MARVTLVGPVYPYRAGIAYCTTRLGEELGADVISFARQYPRFLYPGTSDVDPTLPRFERARFLLDIVNPITWVRTALRLRREKPDAVILVWWVWVWALPYLTLIALLPRRTRVILQCHNIGDKEPAAWKRFLTNLVLRRGQVLVVHAKSEAEDAARRVFGSSKFLGAPRSSSEEIRATPRNSEEPEELRGTEEPEELRGTPRNRIVTTFLPVHAVGGDIPSREEARRRLGVRGHVALCFGHVRPYKGLDIALRAWRLLKKDVTLLVAGEAWWKGEGEYRQLAKGLANVSLEFRFIPNSEVATYFAATDVVLAPYRVEAQSGVALTAFYFGRPVIASTVGGLPEIIHDGVNGMLIPPESPEALARAVDDFFARRDREAMERAAADSGRKYSWAEYARLFRALVEGA